MHMVTYLTSQYGSLHYPVLANVAEGLLSVMGENVTGSVGQRMGKEEGDVREESLMPTKSDHKQ